MITITAGELKPALAGFAKVVSSKAALECMRCIRVKATPEQTTILGTDLDMFAEVELPGATCDSTESFLLPLDRLQSATRTLPPNALLYLEPGKIAFDLGGGRVNENVASPEAEEFPEAPALNIRATPLPESFSQRFNEAMSCASTDATRYVLNGVCLDVSERSGHYLVGTDGRRLFSANSFALPLDESIIIPKHKLLAWRGLADLPWALGASKTDDRTHVRIVAGNWTLTIKALDGNYPNWRQVVPRAERYRTKVTLPDAHGFAKIVQSLPAADAKDKSVDLVIERGTVAVKDTSGGTAIALAGAKATGPDLTIRVNRDYLVKALDCGLTQIGLIDAMSPLHFTREGRQMVVMPMRVTDAAPVSASEPSTEETPPAPPEPQPERTTMTATNGHHTNGATTSRINGATRSNNNPATERPALDSAIEKLDALKTTFREALNGLTELTALLRQSVRDQKAGEKEIHQVRQTLRSLQSVRI